MTVPHLPLDLRARHESGHRVDHQDVDRARFDEHVGDLQRLLTGVRLRDDEIVRVHAELARVLRVQCVLRVDERSDATGRLGVGHGVERHGGLTRGLRAVDLHDATPGEPTDAECHVERESAGGDDLDRRPGVIPQPHHGTLAVGLVDLREGQLERLLTVLRVAGLTGPGLGLGCHVSAPFVIDLRHLPIGLLCSPLADVTGRVRHDPSDQARRPLPVEERRPVDSGTRLFTATSMPRTDVRGEATRRPRRASAVVRRRRTRHTAPTTPA